MRYFTVQEANAFIPALRSTFGYIEKLRHQVVSLVSDLEKLGDQPDLDATSVPEDVGAPVKAKRQKILAALGEIRRAVHELESHGLIVKQLDGLVDFRSLRGQRPVYLSWRKGEEQVDHWHEVWSDPDSLQPVDRFFSKPLLN
jgi:hypothetical protein